MAPVSKISQQVEAIRKKALPILKKNNVVKAGIFGSTVRGGTRY